MGPAYENLKTKAITMACHLTNEHRSTIKMFHFLGNPWSFHIFFDVSTAGWYAQVPICGLSRLDSVVTLFVCDVTTMGAPMCLAEVGKESGGHLGISSKAGNSP